MKLVIIISFLLFSYIGFSQQLTYKPVNPNFGGDTFNYQFLMSSAQAQNSFKDPMSDRRNEETELERLNGDLNRQLLSQISRQLFTSEFGEDLTEGTFNFGSLALEIFDTGNGLVINILDTTTGEQTQIIIPN
jgi:curli production assembly/transport component CsgF